MLRIEGSEYFGRMVDGDILKLYVKGTVEETHQKYATDAVVELLRPTLEVEVRVQKYPVRGLHKAGTRAKKRNFNFCTKLRPLRGNPRQSWILDSLMWIPHSFSVEIGFRITIISGIPDSKVLDSGFHRQKFKKSLESVFQKQKFPGIRSPLHQATHYRKIPEKKPPCISPPKFPPWKFSHKYKVTDKTKTVNFLPTIRLAKRG